MTPHSPDPDAANLDAANLDAVNLDAFHPDLPSKPSFPQTQTSPDVTSLPRRLPGWRFWLPLLFQAGLILSVPAQDAYTYAVGRQITLQTAPVDPYDLLRGHYQTLSYDISRPDQLGKLPGGQWLMQARSKPFYVILEAPASKSNPPQPWQPQRISPDRPTDLADNQVALQGRIDGYGQITYGLETYYMPEAERTQLNQDISQQQGRAFVVDAKVDGSGNAVPIRLWVASRSYEF